MKKVIVLITFVVTCITSQAQKLIKLEDGISTTIHLNSIRMLQTESINHVTLSDNEEARKYAATVKFGKKTFELSVINPKDQSFVWGHYKAEIQRGFILKDSDYSSAGSSEEFELVDGNNTYLVKYRTNPYTGSSWSVMIYFKQPDGKTKTFWGTGSQK